MTRNESTIYIQVLTIAQEHLGPSSKQLIDRQIMNHLCKNPEDLTGRDLEVLLDWIRAMAGMLLEDKQEARTFIERLQALVIRHRVASSRHLV